MTTRLRSFVVFVAIVFVFVLIVIYTSQSIEWTRLRMPKTNNAKPRLNVILLTRMSSGSTVVGNIMRGRRR